MLILLCLLDPRTVQVVEDTAAGVRLRRKKKA